VRCRGLYAVFLLLFFQLVDDLGQFLALSLVAGHLVRDFLELIELFDNTGLHLVLFVFVAFVEFIALQTS
jgi:hypothetical protein